MKEEAKAAKLERRLMFCGITAAARRLGCSREHLSRVLHGSRKPNEKLARALKRMGVEIF